MQPTLNPQATGHNYTMAVYSPRRVVKIYDRVRVPTDQINYAQGRRRGISTTAQRRKTARVRTTLRGFYAQNTHASQKNNVHWKLRQNRPATSAGYGGGGGQSNVSEIDPSTCGLNWISARSGRRMRGLGGCYLESLLLTAEAAGRGGILSLIWSRYFASEKPLILWVGACALSTVHRQTLVGRQSLHCQALIKMSMSMTTSSLCWSIVDLYSA